MSILETNKIDMVATRPDSRVVRLIITDHLDWDDVETHSRLLQEKVNAYLDFVETGQVNRLPGHRIPSSPEFRIILAVPQLPSPEAQDFLSQVRQFLAGISIGFEIEVRRGRSAV